MTLRERHVLQQVRRSLFCMKHNKFVGQEPQFGLLVSLNFNNPTIQTLICTIYAQNNSILQDFSLPFKKQALCCNNYTEFGK